MTDIIVYPRTVDSSTSSSQVPPHSKSASFLEHEKDSFETMRGSVADDESQDSLNTGTSPVSSPEASLESTPPTQESLSRDPLAPPSPEDDLPLESFFSEQSDSSPTTPLNTSQEIQEALQTGHTLCDLQSPSLDDLPGSPMRVDTPPPPEPTASRSWQDDGDELRQLMEKHRKMLESQVAIPVRVPTPPTPEPDEHPCLRDEDVLHPADPELSQRSSATLSRAPSQMDVSPRMEAE